MWRLMCCLLFMFCVLASCKLMPNVQGEGSALLQGVWSQDSISDRDKLLSYTQHKFKFTCDSFYVDLTTHSKVNYYPDSCFNDGIWREYAKGVYEVRADTLFMLGTYTKDNYKQKITGCYKIGQYIKSFKIKSSESRRLVFESTDNQSILHLNLKEHIICSPKEL